MNDLGEYERRIAAALTRIGSGISRLRQAPATETEPAGGLEEMPAEVPDADDPARDPEGDLAAARAALDDERVVSAQLEERLRNLRDKQEAREAALVAERDAARAQAAGLEEALQVLRESQAELGRTVAQLRAALAEEVAEPDLVNRAMQAEIEGLQALRTADAAEVAAVLSELRPLIGEDR